MWAKTASGPQAIERCGDVLSEFEEMRVSGVVAYSLHTMGDHRFGTHYHFGTPSIQQIFDYFTLHMETLAQYHCLRS